MPIAPNGPAPYAAPSTVIATVLQHRDRGLPEPVTSEVVNRVIESEAMAPRVLKTLVLLDLIDGEGKILPQFNELAHAQTQEDFLARFADVVRAGYADVFQYIEPATADLERIEGQFRSYTPRGQRERMVTLFRGLCAYTGIVGSDEQHVKVPTQRRTKAATQAKESDTSSNKSTASASKQKAPQPPPPPPPQDNAAEKNLVVRGLLQTLPPVGAVFPEKRRQEWADAMLAAFALIYEREPGTERGDDD
jgi:hypothetical protein